MAKIISYEDLGYQDTCDIEVDHLDHQYYLSNGTLTSNSHAVAYAIGSYQCAYLQTHYEPEWLCAYVETQLGDPDSRAEALTTIKSFGYKIDKVDINYSDRKWTIGPDNKSFVPSFLTVKGIGEAAIAEILENRPYESIEQLLWNEDGTWRHSKFNKAVLEKLIKIGAFTSMDVVGEDKPFGSYKQMHEVIIENYDMIKKPPLKRPKEGDRRGSALFKELLLESDRTEWSKEERAYFYKEFVGQSDVKMVVDEDVLNSLQRHKIKSIDELEVGERTIAWFFVKSVDKKTTKTGRDYALLTCAGEGDRDRRIFCWGIDALTRVKPNKVYIAEIEVKDENFMSTSTAKMKTIG